MWRQRRRFLDEAGAGLLGAWLCLPVLSAGRRRLAARRDTPRRPEIGRALEASERYLLGRQSRDGAWRSDVYGPFQGGDALTPLVASSLQATRSGSARPAVDHARRFLLELSGRGVDVATLLTELSYPLYTAAGVIELLAADRSERTREVARRWHRYLLGLQLNESLGWSPDDAFYGGWGYAAAPPERPDDGVGASPVLEPNVSATATALLALRQSRERVGREVYHKALRFLRRCQNLDDSQSPDHGGFYFLQLDAVRNKAGRRADGSGFASYGSATADGVRALLACGLEPERRPLEAALQWCRRNFRATTHPGAYTRSREPRREALFYYYARSVCRALLESRFAGVCDPAGTPWAMALADELIRRQNDDGSWRNSVVDNREDDPLVATSLAIDALAACRTALAVRGS